MSNLEVVLWLQSGRQFEISWIPDPGYAPRQQLVPRLDLAQVVPAVDEHRFVNVDTLAFTLTISWQEAREQYALGRRRFHYRELTGWESPDEQYDRDRMKAWDMIATKAREQHERDTALMAAGAFPGEPPKPFGWSAPVTAIAMAAPYGLEDLALAHLVTHKSIIKQLSQKQLLKLYDDLISPIKPIAPPPPPVE